MQQQPLAFTLVKTVVSARDDGKVLSPALATAWDLLHTELSPAHRVIASEVKWSPTHQDDLRFVIDGVRKQFDKDPELEGEFLAFLAEVEPFGDSEEDASILPVVIGITSGSTIPPPVGEVAFAFDNLDPIAEPTTNLEFETSENSHTDQLREATAVEQPAAATPSALEDDFAQAEEGDRATELDEADALTNETSKPGVEDELELPEAEDLALEADETSITPAAEQTEALDLDQVSAPLKTYSGVNPESSTSTLLRYWPLAAGALFLAVISLGVWTFSSPASDPKFNNENHETAIPTDTVAEKGMASAPQQEPSVTYTTPNIARLSEEVDSLRLAGDYASALNQQQEIATLLQAKDSPSQETAQAYSELAILYSTQGNVLQAIVEQRKSLGFARQAFAKTDPALGRSHLKLAAFYTNNNELHMARAHLQQARQIFGQAQELVLPTDLEKTDQIEQQILKAS